MSDSETQTRSTDGQTADSKASELPTASDVPADRAADTNASVPSTECEEPGRIPERGFMRFGAFESLELIGSGGMGLVCKARDPELPREVALKLMLNGKNASHTARERFLREAHAIAQLRHPNIIAIHRCAEHDGEPYFTMDYIAGGNLARHKERFRGNAYVVSILIEKVARAIQF